MHEGGDFDASFDELYTVAYRAAFRLLGQRDDADDVAQEALVRAFVRWRRLRRHPHPKAWVARVSTNLAVDRWRADRRAQPEIDAPRVPQPDVSAVGRADVVAALSRLPRRQREVAVLLYLADMAEDDVAAALGVSDGTVKQHASRARDALRLALEEGS